jgi:hypothetical protein
MKSTVSASLLPILLQSIPKFRTSRTSTEKMRMHKNKVNEAIAEELEPMHQDAEKMYNHLAGNLTEKML